MLIRIRIHDPVWNSIAFLSKNYFLKSAPPSTVNFVSLLQSGFMEIIYPTLDKASKDAIKNQVDPKELKAGAVKIRAAVIDHTIGKN
jgi:hypothetical protein